MGRGREAPLYRKVNTTAHGVPHGHGADYADRRGAREGERQRMAKGVRRGLDYTPLFRFLLSRVGQPWVAVRAEAVRRLDREEPIGWMVAPNREAGVPFFRTGESSLFSGLFVDDGGLLQRVDPTLGPESLLPACGCCTHTFNGVRFTRPFEDGTG